MNTVYTGGTFDLLHPGHIRLLEGCRRIAGSDGLVVVGLNTDEFIERFKDRRPIQSYEERKMMLESCKHVDLVIENFGEEDSKKTIESVRTTTYQKFDYGRKVDFVVIGSDWAGRDYYGQMGFTKEWLDEMNIDLLYFDRRSGHSSTNLKETIRK